MNVNRRRFLAIGASFAAAPAMAQQNTWTGRAFGAEASIDLRGPAEVTAPALESAQALIAQIESLFSLYNPTSDLSTLNARGAGVVSARFETLMAIADQAHTLTQGLFDPTVQPLWRALAEGGDVAAARGLIGWDRVTRRGNRVRLGPGQALTFNGIAQGFATDLVADMLRERGFDKTLVNIGEYRGAGGHGGLVWLTPCMVFWPIARLRIWRLPHPAPWRPRLGHMVTSFMGCGCRAGSRCRWRRNQRVWRMHYRPGWCWPILTW